MFLAIPVPLCSFSVFQIMSNPSSNSFRPNSTLRSRPKSYMAWEPGPDGPSDPTSGAPPSAVSETWHKECCEKRRSCERTSRDAQVVRGDKILEVYAAPPTSGARTTRVKATREPGTLKTGRTNIRCLRPRRSGVTC